MESISAVDWLIEEYFGGEISCTPEFINYINHAKEMQKAQLERCYNHGQFAIVDHGHGDSFEDYYNREFKPSQDGKDKN